MFKKKQVLVSVCIPVYNTEKYLHACLDSLVNQTFLFNEINDNPFEVIVVDDCSPGKDDEGNDCGKIVSDFAKKVSFPVRYFLNKENLSVFEVRRKSVYNAKGKYILFLDSDDYLLPNAIQIMFYAAESDQCDYVHTKIKLCNTGNLEKNIINYFIRKSSLIYPAFLSNEKLRQEYFFNSSINGLVISKLFSRELLLKCYDNIPPVYCNLSEDGLLSFIISLFAQKYKGIITETYAYNLNVGMTAKIKITTLDKWKSQCSASTVYTVIFDWMKTHEIPDDIKECISEQCNATLLNLAYTYRRGVDASIKDQALSMFYDYWGKSYVEKAFEYIDSKKARHCHKIFFPFYLETKHSVYPAPALFD